MRQFRMRFDELFELSGDGAVTRHKITLNGKTVPKKLRIEKNDLVGGVKILNFRYLDWAVRKTRDGYVCYGFLAPKDDGRELGK